jgi:lipopolysaccharide biosynthesis glycosyltransferase
MKLAITVRMDDNIKEMTDLTFPIIEEYAKRCNCDIIRLSHQPSVMSDDGLTHFRIMELYNLYDQYDRILNLDADILIMRRCPNLFEIVPEQAIGTIFEDIGTRTSARMSCIRNVQAQFGEIYWFGGYINTGVFLTSKCHRDIFTPIDNQYYTGWGSDDVHIGYQINKLKMLIYRLPFHFNHMTMFSEPWNNSASRFNSYIIHYAGNGIFDSTSKISQIRNDIMYV